MHSNTQETVPASAVCSGRVRRIRSTRTTLRGDAMTNQTSRRSFLGISALGLVAAVVPDVVRPASAMSGPGNKISNSSPEISIWVTSGDERFAAAPRATWRPVVGTPTTDQLRLNPSMKFQEILGFGGAFTDATCYTFNRLSPPAREQLLHELF